MITTVVMTRDRRDDLLASLAHHEGPVVVVDNGSRDGTLEALEALRRPDLTVIALPTNAGAPARNIGVRAAGTPYVAFADDDSWWAPGALARAEQVLDEHPRLGLLAARLLVGPDERVDPVCDELAAAPLGRAPDLPGPDVLGFMACAAVVRRDAFLACGGFDPGRVLPRRGGAPGARPGGRRRGGWPTCRTSSRTTTRPATAAAAATPVPR